MHDRDMDLVLGNLVRAVALLETCQPLASLVPEVRINLAYALPGATDPGQVAAVDGRITRVGGWPRAAGLPAFGASDHMARLLVEARRYDPSLRAGMNFAWSRRLCDHLRTRGYNPVMIDRSAEPADVALNDGRSMPWKIDTLAGQCGGRLPRLFYEGPAPGKEPLFVLLGASALEVAREVCDMARDFAGTPPAN